MSDDDLLIVQRFKIKPLALAIAVASCAGSVQAAAPMEMEEVVVTATKRSQSVQDVPISMSVLGEGQLENNGIGDLEDFAQMLPTVNYVSLGPGTGNVYMRGISSGGESALGSNPNVAVYMDEQPVTAVGAFLNPHVYDISRIETLSGPQGTLFGANAQAGSIRIITNKPEVGVFEAGYDIEFNSVNKGGTGNLLEGFVNIPVGDNAAIRLVGWRKDEAGFIDNVPGTHTFDYSYIRDGWIAGGDPALIAIAQDITIDNAGLVKEDFNEAETKGFRATAAIDLNENWTLSAGVMRQTLDSVGVWDHDPDEVGDLEVVRFLPDASDDDWTQISVTVEGQIGGMTLTYAGADLDRERYFQADYSLYSDASLSPGYVSSYYSCYVAYFGACEDPSILFTGDNKYERSNHELRLASAQDQRLRWLVGMFYEDASHDFDLEWHVLGIAGLRGNGETRGYGIFGRTDAAGNPVIFPGGVPAALEEPDIYWTTDQFRANEEFAYFGELAYDVTERLTVSYSARFFDYDSTLVGFSGTFYWPNNRLGPRTEPFNTNLVTNDKDSVHKVNATFTVNDDMMVYGTWSEGYRPGGLNRVYDTPIGGTYAPDFLTSYEVGMKSTLMDGRLRLNAAVYMQSWDNFQQSKIDTSVSVLSLTDNVGNAESDGLEMDATFLINTNWSVNFGLSYIDATLSEGYWLRASDEGVTPPQAPAGQELPRVPDLKWNVSSRYHFNVMGMDSFIQGSYTHTGESYNLLYGTSVTRGRDLQEDYQILNLGWGIESDSWAAELFVKNVTDERGQVFINGASYDSRITSNRPRTIGLRFRQKL